MAGRQVEWDFALRLRAVTPNTMPLARLAEYLRQYSALLGEGNEPRYAGIVKGSAMLRAAVPIDRRLETKVRLMAAEIGHEDNGAHNVARSIGEMMAHDRITGEVKDRQGAVLLHFRRAVAPAAEVLEHIVQDTGAVDGIVVGLKGEDDTVHLSLRDVTGQVHKVTLRDLNLARSLGRHFRGEPLRVHVHGTWKRTAEGVWEGHALYLDRIEELDPEPARALIHRLSAAPGNRWASMDDPADELRQYRSDE